ncbi:hypothetical protein NQ318_023175 [Aromia moschata]|uniref:Uncharacterized protein n=1 Tax=Aromia moschata TaxID=1265417 RepID=A0AAV8Y154_9CUCU|nr:hypothetical protein NQ318_023175 [Aromia moschata]
MRIPFQSNDKSGHTCVLCEVIVDEIMDHPCIEGYGHIYIDYNHLFYLVLVYKKNTCVCNIVQVCANSLTTSALFIDRFVMFRLVEVCPSPSMGCKQDIFFHRALIASV